MGNKKLNITKAKWVADKALVKFGKFILRPESTLDDFESFEEYKRVTEIESVDNAILLADAGNTYQKSQILPSELLKQRDELLEICKVAEKHHQGAHSAIGMLLRNAIYNSTK